MENMMTGRIIAKQKMIVSFSVIFWCDLKNIIICKGLLLPALKTFSKAKARNMIFFLIMQCKHLQIAMKVYNKIGEMQVFGT